MNTPGKKHKPDNYKWVVMGIVMAGTLMAALYSSIVNVSIPAIMADFGASVDEIEWVITGYMIAFATLFYYYRQHNELLFFGVLQIFFLPVLVYFFWWVRKVWQNEAMADFQHTMKMNWLASACTNLGFITLLILHQIG